MTRKVFNVKEYGASGSGKAKDTRSIQKAIDDCSLCGGGTVYFPRGTYLFGTIHLKSNISLYLETESVLLGSPCKEDYEVDPGGITPVIGSGYLITGEAAENISIEGKGTIDGQGYRFWTSEMLNAVALKPKEYRPRALMYLVNCRHIIVRDIVVKNSPCFTLWFLGCEDVNIDGISIANSPNGPNTDGIDVDCSRDVRISNCRINSGDDCIALKSDANRLGSSLPCENIIVTNCILSTSCCGIRIGYEGDAPIRNCVFNNLVIRDADIGLDLITVIPECPPGTGLRIDKGAEIERVIFSNIIMEKTARAFYIWLGSEIPNREVAGRIENILISNVIATAANSSYIGGMPGNPVRNVNLSNVLIHMHGEMKGTAALGEKPGVWGNGRQPHAFYFQYLEGAKLQNVQIDWNKSAGEWRETLNCENVKDMEISEFSEKNRRRKSGVSAMRLFKSERVLIHNGCAYETEISETPDVPVKQLTSNQNPAAENTPSIRPRKKGTDLR